MSTQEEYLCYGKHKLRNLLRGNDSQIQDFGGKTSFLVIIIIIIIDFKKINQTWQLRLKLQGIRKYIYYRFSRSISTKIHSF